MKNNEITLKIMQKVANEEKHKVSQTLLILLPSTILLSVVIIFTSEKTIARLVERDAFKIFTRIETSSDNLIPRAVSIINYFWEEITEGFLAITIISSIALYLLISRSKITSYPKRFKEIKKYLTKI